MSKGIGDDQLGILAGLQLLFSRRTRLSIIGEYRKSFDSGPGRDLEQTIRGLVGIRSIPSIKSWAAANLIFLLDHENEDTSTTTINLQAGRSITPNLGAYLEALFPGSGRDVIEHGIHLLAVTTPFGFGSQPLDFVNCIRRDTTRFGRFAFTTNVRPSVMDYALVADSGEIYFIDGVGTSRRVPADPPWGCVPAPCVSKSKSSVTHKSG